MATLETAVVLGIKPSTRQPSASCRIQQQARVSISRRRIRVARGPRGRGRLGCPRLKDLLDLRGDLFFLGVAKQAPNHWSEVPVPKKWLALAKNGIVLLFLYISSLPCHISELLQGFQEGVIVHQSGRIASKLVYSNQQMLHTVSGCLFLKVIYLGSFEVLGMTREKKVF